MRKTTLLVVLFIIVALGLGWQAALMQRTGPFEVRTGNLRVDGVVLNVEIADNKGEWARGLSGREQLTDNQGMLFLFPDSQRRSFWMQKMRFPLDILFVSEGQISEIEAGVPAPSEQQDGREIRVVSQDQADMVLEVVSGWSQRHGIRVGDRVSLE